MDQYFGLAHRFLRCTHLKMCPHSAALTVDKCHAMSKQKKQYPRGFRWHFIATYDDHYNMKEVSVHWRGFLIVSYYTNFSHVVNIATRFQNGHSVDVSCCDTHLLQWSRRVIMLTCNTNVKYNSFLTCACAISMALQLLL